MNDIRQRWKSFEAEGEEKVKQNIADEAYKEADMKSAAAWLEYRTAVRREAQRFNRPKPPAAKPSGTSRAPERTPSPGRARSAEPQRAPGEVRPLEPPRASAEMAGPDKSGAPSEVRYAEEPRAAVLARRFEARERTDVARPEPPRGRKAARAVVLAWIALVAAVLGLFASIACGVAVWHLASTIHP
jgi:hypothetical protein